MPSGLKITVKMTPRPDTMLNHGPMSTARSSATNMIPLLVMTPATMPPLTDVMPAITAVEKTVRPSKMLNDWKVTFVCRSEEHTSELQSLMRNSYAVFCLKQNKKNNNQT